MAFPSEAHRKILARLLKRYDYGTKEWADIRREGAEDMRYVACDGWSDTDRNVRKAAGRPTLWFDELSQYVNQLINTVRQHKRAVEVTAVGTGANDKTAEYRANRIRQIEYRSNAQQAYTIGFENAVQRSYGFWRICAQYAKGPSQSGGQGDGFVQELLIEPCVNPDLVTPDPDITKPTGADMRWLLYEERWAIDDFKAKYPNARVQNFDGETLKEAPTWMDENSLRVAEYWEVDTKRRTLLLFKATSGREGVPARDWEVYADEVSQPAWAFLRGRTPDKSREVEVPTVTSYLTNGFEILETTPWSGSSIPFICCFGKILYVKQGDKGATKKIIMSLVRPARDPAMQYSYLRTSEAEQVGMTTKNPYLAYRGQLNDDEKNEIAKSMHEPVAVLTFGATTEATGQQQILPPMQRNQFEPALQALEVTAESTRRSIQAAMGGGALPTSALRKNEKSGVALKEIKASEQVGSYHFVDSYEMAITRTGELLNELIPFYDDTAREVTVRNRKAEPKTVRINDQTHLAPGQEDPIMVTDGAHDVTLSTGPSYDSEREAAADFAESLIGTPFAGLIADLIVKLRNLGPIGDEMAERLTPPQFKKPKEGEGPDPQQVAQQLQQMKGLIDALTKELNAKNDLIETETVKMRGQVELEKVKQAGTMAQTHADNDAKMFIERMKVVAELLKVRATLEQKHTEAMIDAAAAELDREVAQATQETERQDTAAEAEAQRAHEADMADRQTVATEASAT